ncbi:MAG: Smr/MutS family protein [Gammaproteobacteria bacterium]|nr:Smr/MutS family protein [Gammaproteobacteria bacterium]
MDSGNDELIAFRRAMADVKPLERQNRVVAQRRRPPPRARHARAARLAVLNESLNGELIEQPSGEIEFRRPGVSAQTLKELGRGRFSVAAEIDLHGMTRVEAHEALKATVVAARLRGLACLRVIHGKGSGSGPGGPVLKHAVCEWLARWDDVLAFTSATRRHGGTGAVYVLLRRR